MLNRPNKYYLIITLLIAAAQFASAQDVFEFESSDIIIDDAAIEEATVLRPGQVTVFDRDDIEASGARTVADVVERAPGVTVSRQGGILEPQSVSIRGGSSEHALVLVDGKAADSLWTGGSDLGAISVSGVERIEVIRGASAATYGEGAVSGVINIITTDAGYEQAAGELEYGFASFNTHQLNGKLSGPLGSETGLSGEISAGGLYTAGVYSYEISDQQQVRANNDGWAADSSASIDWNQDADKAASAELKLKGSFYASERGTPGLMEFLTPEARIKNARGNAGLGFEMESENLGSFDADADYSYKYSLYTNPDEEISDSNENSSISASAGWVDYFEIGTALIDASVDAGYSFDYLFSTALTDSTGSAVDGEAFRHAVNIRSSLNIIWQSFDLTPAAGFDWVLNDYRALEPADDAAFSWSAAAGWAPYRTDFEDGPLYIKLNAGTAYKNPSFQDLFWPSGALAAGNPDLRPETSLNFDAGVFLSLLEKSDLLSFEVEAVGFFSTAEDLIQWLPSAGGVWRPYNIGNVHNYGTELAGKIKIDELIEGVLIDTDLVYNWLRCLDADASSVNYGRQLAYRPEHSGNISIMFTMPDLFSLEVSGSYLGYRYTNNANTKYLDQVVLLSAAMNYDITESFGISASTDNLLNTSYIDRLGYPVPGIEWCIKGRIDF